MARQGGSRLDRNLDGRIDAPGAAIMDTAWDGIATAVMRPVLGPLTANLAQLLPFSSTPSFDPGWFGYVSKDLRTELGMKVRGPTAAATAATAASSAAEPRLWAAIQAAADQAQGDPGTEPERVVLERHRRADPLHPRADPVHDALDEPLHLPAGDRVHRARPHALIRSRPDEAQPPVRASAAGPALAPRLLSQSRIERPAGVTWPSS